MMIRYFWLPAIAFFILGCVLPVPAQLRPDTRYDTSFKVVHIFVALCDNRYQGIVPVPEKIGNGQDPDHNLYWGCGMGIRSYFGKSKEWVLVSKQKTNAARMERLVFRHQRLRYYLVADAWNGRYIEACTKDFLRSCSGQLKDTLHTGGRVIGMNGNAALLAYIGHDGLMDFRLSESFGNTDGRQRPCMILACKSKQFFSPVLRQTGALPLVWTTGLMCPEAYTVHDAITAFIAGGSAEAIRSAAAMAYSRYQKCSIRAARNLLVTGW